MKCGGFDFPCFFRRGGKFPSQYSKILAEMKVHGFLCHGGYAYAIFVVLHYYCRCGLIFGSPKAARIHNTKMHNSNHNNDANYNGVPDSSHSDDSDNGMDQNYALTSFCYPQM